MLKNFSSISYCATYIPILMPGNFQQNSGGGSGTRSRALLWVAFAAISFITAALAWWPLGLVGIVGSILAGQRLQACILGLLLDLTFTAPSTHLTNLYGFPFLGTALALCILAHLAARIVRPRATLG